MHNTHPSKPCKLITIICPIYNEEAAIPLFYDRIKKVIDSLQNRYQFEILFTNNASTDRSLSIILALREQDSKVQILTLSRNFGYQASLQAGLSNSPGEAIFIVDVDCEDPPEMLGDFITKWEEGYDIVYGVRMDRSEFWIIKNLRKLFYRLLQKIADMDIVLYMAEFSFLSNHVRKQIINNQNRFPFLRAEIGYTGFQRYGIPYTRQPRNAGKTHYRFFNILSFAVTGFLSSSTFPLRLAGYLLLPFFLINLLALVFILTSNNNQFFRFLMVFDFLHVTFFITTMSIYLSKIHQNIMARPVFIINEKLSYLNHKIEKE